MLRLRVCVCVSLPVEQDLLDQSGLGHVTHLTRTEWSVLRGALGRPRRLSLNFLKQERQKLEAHRRVRSMQTHTHTQLGGSS